MGIESIRRSTISRGGIHVVGRLPPLGQLYLWNHCGKTYAIIEGVAVKVPSAEELDALALSLGPRGTVCQGRVQSKDGGRKHEERDGSDSVEDGALTDTDARDTGGKVVNDLAQGDNGEVESREVVVEEELTLHQEEREVMKRPTEDRGTDLVVESLKGSIRVVVAAALPSKNSESLEDDPDGNGSARRPPDNRVTKEVDLGVVSTPEVDTSAEDGPRFGARIPSMRLGEAGVCPPHNLLKLKEFAEEARTTVVDLFDIVAELRVSIGLDVPQAVVHSAATSAGHLLLFRCPIGKFDLVREQSTAGHDMDKAELCLNSSDTGLGDGAQRPLLNDLDAEVIVGIASKTLITIGRDLVLPVSLSDRGSDVMRMEAAVGRAVEESENSAILDVFG